jgi:prolyl-tRNA editing enzyme YbaK/EbsC (Cys-tRNA(Pro) deacylase)
MSQNPALERACRYLDQFNLNLLPQEHEQTTKTSIEAAEALGVEVVQIAKLEEVERITGYRVGGVCPFDIDPNIPIYFDDSMKRFEIVYSAAGSSHSFLPITLGQLEMVTSGSIVDMQKDAIS